MNHNIENNEQIEPKKTKKTNRKVWFSLFWWIVGITNFILCLVIFFQLLFRYYTDEIVGRVLREVVELKSEELYSLTYDDIKLNFIVNYIKISNLKLSPNRQVYSRLETTNQSLNKLYEFRIEKVYIEGFNIGELYFKKTLKLKEFHISDLDITIEGDKQTTEANKEQAFKMSNLYFLISDYLKELRVENFTLEEGRFLYRYFKDSLENRNVDKEFQLKNITLAAKGFVIDSLSTESYPFQLENLKVNLGANKLTLNNDLTLAADTLSLATKAGYLYLKNLQLNSNTKGNAALELPYVYFKGVNFLKVYLEKNLEIDTLLISQPTINFSKKGSRPVRKSGQPTVSPDLYAPLSEYLFSLKLNHLLVDSASVTGNQLPQLNNVSARFHGILIDSLTKEKRRLVAYSDSIELSIANFEYALADSLHNLSWNELTYSTNAKLVTLTGFEVATNGDAKYLVSKKRVKQRTLLNTRIPKITLSAFDIWALLADRTIDLEAIRLNAPTFNIFSVKKEALIGSETQKINPENLYPLIEDNLQWLKAQRINIDNGKFHWEQQLSTDSTLKAGANEIDLLLDRFEISKNSYREITRLLQSQNMRVRLKNGYFELPDTSHRVELSSVQFALTDSVIEFSDVNIIPKYSQSELHNSDKTETYIKATIPQILVRSADLRTLILEQEGDFGFMRLIKPQVAIYKPVNPKDEDDFVDEEEEINTLPFLSSSQLRIDSGKVQLYSYGNGGVSKKFDLPAINTILNQFSTDSLGSTPAELIAASDLKFETQNYTLLLPDSIHQLNVRYLKLASTAKKLDLKDVLIAPRSNLLANGNTNYTLKIPKLSFIGLEVEQFVKDNRFIADTLIISSSDIETFIFTGNDTANTRLNWEELPRFLANSMQRYEVKTLLLEKSNFNIVIADTITKDLQRILIKEVSLKIDSFHISPKTQPSIFRPLYSSMTQLSLKSLEHINDKGTITFDSLYFSDNLPSKLMVSKLKVHSRYPLSKDKLLDFGNKPQYDFSLEKLTIDSLSLFELLVQNNLSIRKIELEKPALRLKTNGQSGGEKQGLIHTDSLRNLLTQVFDKVNLGKITISNGEAEIAVQSKRKQQPLAFYISKDGANQQERALALKPVVLLTHDKAKRIKIDTLRERNLLLKNLTRPNEKEVLKISLEGIQGDHYKISTDTFQVNRLANVLLHERISYSVRNLQADLPDTTFSIAAKDLYFDTNTETLELNQFKAAHHVKAQKLFQLKGVQTDWLSFNAQQLSFKGINLEEIFNKNIVNLQTIRADSLVGDIFRDKNVPFPEQNRPPMPQEALKMLPFTFSLDSLNLNNSTITYKEAAEKTAVDSSFTDDAITRTGQIQFRELNADFTGLTNDPLKLKNGAKAILNTEALLMGSGKLKAVFEFDLADPYNSYRFDGELDSMSLPQLNPMLEKLAYLQIRSGQARRLRFWVTANEDYAVGKMRFLYNNLSISLVDKTYEVGLHEYVFSLIANTFFIRTSNSRFFHFNKDGKIYAPKDPSRSVFNHWAKALLSGVRSSITSWQPKEGKEILKKWEKENRLRYKR